MTRSTRLDRLLVFAYVAIAALPVIAMVVGLRGREIGGSLAAVKRPPVGFRKLVTERYQHQLTAWFEASVGLRGSSIGVDNAILYHAFRETKFGSSVRIGRDGVLFNDEDIGHYNKVTSQLAGPEHADALAARIAALQTRLAARGKALVPLIVPAKTSVWRDKIPPRWAADLGTPRPTDVHIYDVMVRALQAHRVAYVDARALLTAPGLRREDVWGVDARHWTEYGACLAMHEVVARYAELAAAPRPVHTCELGTIPPTSKHADLDLLRLLNAYAVAPAVTRLPTATHATRPPPGPRPRVLFVSTSFGWTPMGDAERSGAFGALHMNYYNQLFVDWPSNVQSKVEPGTPAWRAITLEKDLYVLEMFEGLMLEGQPYFAQWMTDLEAALDAP